MRLEPKPVHRKIEMGTPRVLARVVEFAKKLFLHKFSSIMQVVTISRFQRNRFEGSGTI